MLSLFVLDKIKKFFLKFWGYFVIVGIAIVICLFLFKKNSDDSLTFVKRIQDSHNKELEELNKIRIEELLSYKDNEKKYKEQLISVEEKHEESKKIFSENKKEEVIKIIKKYNDKPEELTRKLAEITGFKIVFPEE